MPRTVIAKQEPNFAHKRLVAFDRAIRNIPLNDYGLPKFLYRADLVPPQLLEMDPKEQYDILNTASIAISWREGFPTFNNGVPLWGHMDFETSEDYAMFEAYLGLVHMSGVRKLVDVNAIPRFADVPIESIQAVFIFNYWAIRAKAYDMFLQAAHAKLREQRIMSAEGSQYLMAEKLLGKIELRLETIFSGDKMDLLEPDKAVKMLRDIYEIRARALGQESGKGRFKNDENAPPPGATLEVTLRNVAKISGASSDVEVKSANNNTIEMLRNNPDTAALAQELIVKLTYNNKDAKAPEGSREGANNAAPKAPSNDEDAEELFAIDDTDRALLGL